MNKLFSSFIKILVSLFSLSFLQCKNCPQITTYYNMRSDLGYVIRSFFSLPFTNILIVNTYFKNTENSSAIYYVDLQTRNGDTINVVQPAYTIIQMSYIYSQGKILAINYDRMVVANPYTLESEGILFMPQLVDAQMIGKTDYAVATLKYNVMYIVDINLMVVVRTLDNNGFPNVLNTFNFYTKNFQLLTLKQSEYIFIVVNSYGFYSWTFDLIDLNATYNGYIPVTVVNHTDYAYRQFVKHPTLDIFFIGGANLEIIGFEIMNITTKTYRTQIKLNLYNSQYKLNITNLVFKNISNFTSPELVVVDGIYLYDILLKWDDVNQQYTIPNHISLKYLKEYQTFYTWFEMNNVEQDFRMILSGGYFITIYNTVLRNPFYQLFIGSDFFSRRFLYEGAESYYAFPRARSIQYFSKDYLGAQLSFNSNMTNNPFQEENAYYIVKNCEECLFIKTLDPNTTYSHFMNIIIMYPRVNNLNKTLNITSLGFKWNEVNVNLDPFYYKNQTWVAFGFRNKPANKKFLFTLINMYNTTQNSILTGATDEENSRQSSYALASIEDPDNLEIIGVDLLGYIYVWDFLSPKTIKYSRKTTCLNSDIGVIYQYNKQKWIIFACDNRFVLSYDFQKNTTQFISSVTKNPQSIKAYPRLGIIAIGDTITGNVYIHKFVDGSFLYFLTIQPGTLKDNMISFELLKDNTIWVQYSYSNILFPIGDCIDDVNNCLKCEQTYSFNTNLKFNNQTIYGNGTSQYPYTSAYNFLTAMLMAQRYYQRISGVTSMNVNIVIDPQNKINIPKGFLNFDFSSAISLSIKSKNENQLATLEYTDKLEFSNYNYIGIQDIKIEYALSKIPNECGINFNNIYQNVTLNNIQLQAKNKINTHLNCFQIHVDKTNIQVLKLSIQDQDFSLHKSIISTLYADWVNLQNLQLNNCVFGDNFSLVTQNSNLIVNLTSVSITNNICAKDRASDVSSLFSAGLFNVEDLQIKNNNFCNKIIFSSVSTLEQQNYQFQFKNIQLLNNSFIAKTSYLFFNSLYSMIQKPSHTVIFQHIFFENNSLQIINEGDLTQSSFIQTNKISSHLFEDITFKNHHEISFTEIEYSDLVQINKFYCINDQDYLDSSPNTNSGSCLQLYEVKSTKIQKIQINYKKAYNNELINLQNKLFYNLYDFDITDGEFSYMNLMQYTINSFANPFTISSQNSLTLTISNCHFFENNLKIAENSQTFSTSALWVENLLGNVFIIDSTFRNSTSNSIYNFMFIQTISLELRNNTFSNSSLQLDSTKQLGGFMNLIINSLKIVDSSFSKSKSQYGSFIYMQAFGDLIKVEINFSSFNEGYAQVDGGALYVDIKKSKLKMICTDCFFDNIFTFSQGSSTIGFQKYRITTENHDHEMICQGGHIQSIFGVGDNFFTDIFNMKLSLIDIRDIKPLILSSEDQDTTINQSFGKVASQQSTLISSQYSEISIKNCNIKNFQILNQYSNLPLLIKSEFSVVSVVDTIIQDGIFMNSAIKVINGTLTLKKTQFTNIVQQKILNQRQLLDSDENSDNSISSLIIMEDSELKVSEETLFLGTKCYNNCTGAVFYMLNTNFDIQDLTISNSEAAFGGSLFIKGMKDFNQIVSSKFDNNIAQIDGGAIYLQALIEDNFQLQIQNCIIQQNNAISGKGGALFIRSNSLNSTNQKIMILDTELVGNVAQIGGGMYQKEISPLILGNTIFKQNIGKIFGNDTLSYPTHLNFISKDNFLNQYEAKIVEGDTIEVSNFRSGDTLKSLSFELVNDQDEVIRPITVQELQDFDVKVQVGMNQNFQNYSIRGNVSALYDNKNSQQFVFEEFDFIGTPGSVVILEFISDQIYVLDKNKINQYNQNYSFKIIVKFRNCIQGEAISTYSSLTECIVCQEGKYSFDLQECNQCPTGATCNGGAQLTANQGYWRTTNQSSLLISCSLEENCVGGSFGNNICFEGHIGALCEECDISGKYWNDNYAKSAKNSCTKCSEIAYNSWLVLLVTIWTLLSMALAIKGDIQAKLEQGIQNSINFKNQFRQKLNTSKKSQMDSQNVQESVKNVSSKIQSIMEQSSVTQYNDTSKNLKRSRNISIFKRKNTTSSLKVALKKQRKESTEGQKSSIYIKILTNYFQIVSSVATFNLDIPSGIYGIPSFAGQPLKNTLNSFDCFLKDFDISIPFIYFRQMIAFLIPIGYFLIFLLGLGLLQISKRKGRFPFYILATAAMFLIIYIQPDLVSQLIALASCRQIGDTNYILANVSYVCYNKEHTKYVLLFIIPALTIWVLVLPLLLFSMLFKNRYNLNKIKVKMIYGFLYNEYKKEAFYWEFIKMLEKIFIILSLNFYSTAINVKAFLVFVIIVVYGLLSIIVEPFEEQKINSLDNYSTTVCGLTVLLGLFIYQNPFPYFYYSSLGIIVILNSLFIFVILKRIINAYLQKCKNILQNKLQKLVIKIPIIGKYFNQKEEKKKVNSLVKEKVKKVFENYLNMSDEEKQKILIRILKSSFKFTLSNMFGEFCDEDNDINQKSIQYRYSDNSPHKKKSNLTEEQNNLLSKNMSTSPLCYPLFTVEDNVNDDEKQLQNKSNFKFSSLLLFKKDEKYIEKPLETEQCEVYAEEYQGDFKYSYTYQQKNNKILNSLNQQKINEDLIQIIEEQKNHHLSLNSPLIFAPNISQIMSLYEDEIKQNDQEHQEKQQKRVMARLSLLDNFKTENEITPKLEGQEQCGINNEQSKIERNLYESSDIQLLRSLNDELVYQDEVQENSKKVESQIGDNKIEEEQDKKLNNDKFLNNPNDNNPNDINLILFKSDNDLDKVNDDLISNKSKN